MEDSAAHNLLDYKLKTGWKVIEKITKTAGSTGAFFSVCYKVEKDGEICFLKAFDFAKFFGLSELEQPGRSVVDVISDMISAFKYERDLSQHCKDKFVTKVSFVREAGEETIIGFTYSLVPYLIFELADGDVRTQLKFSDKLDVAWKLGSLHDIAVGIKQLHKIDVSHQDLKPSNILLFNKKSKLGDLGRSLCKDLDGPYNDYIFSGDNTYAPPEIMYGYFENDWNKRVFATDCYLLGSMVVFYFTGISMSALLMKNMHENFKIDKWSCGEFDEVKPYIADAFAKALTEFEECIQYDILKKDLKNIVERLCFPFPENRGHEKNIVERGSNFNLERFVSKLDLLHRKMEYQIKK
jgi:eukaryotic-like serine/threonine-protein kinase